MHRDGSEALHLSRWVRLFHDGQRPFVDALLAERYLPLDPLLHAVLRVLEAGPCGFSELAARVSDAQVPAPPDALVRALMMLRDARLIVDAPEDDLALLADALVASPDPVVDQVELTTACPMRCPMCARGEGPLRRGTGFIDRDLFARLVDEIAPAQRRAKPLGLHNMGESLLHPRLDELIALAARAGIRTDLSVNPGLLDLDRYRRLCDAGLSRLTLSLDGLDAATLDAIRGPAAGGDRAAEGVGAILEHRARGTGPQPRLVIQMLRMRRNQHQHAAFLERHSNLRLPDVVACLKDLDANSPRQLFPDGDRPHPTLCRAPWRTVVVLWDGRVVPCCYDGEAERVLGDLGRQTLGEIWRDEPAQRLRAELLGRGRPAGGPCARCVHRPDRFVRPPLDRIPQEPWI